MISVVIVTFEQAALLRSCLDSLGRSSVSHDLEVIVVDNGSPQPYAAGVLEDVGCRVLLVRLESRLTFSAANNVGVAHSQGRWLVFANNDVIVEPLCLERLMAPLLEEPQVGVTGARLLFPGRTVQHAGIEQMLWGYGSNYGSGAAADDARVCDDRLSWAVTGALLATSRDQYDAVRGFHEDYRFGYEDIDFCLTVRENRRHIRYVASAEAVHYQSATLSTGGQDDSREHNYRVFRERWDRVLVPEERHYLARLKSEGVGRIGIIGTGIAAKGLKTVFDSAEIKVVGFAETGSTTVTTLLGRPVWSLQRMAEEPLDCVFIGSQFFAPVERACAAIPGLGVPVFPVLSLAGGIHRAAA